MSNDDRPSGAEVELEAEARYRRERLALYRARVYSGQPTTELRLRELERASEGAEQRLRLARRKTREPVAGGSGPSGGGAG